MIRTSKLSKLAELVGKLRTKCLGLDDFEKFVTERREINKRREDVAELFKGLIENHQIKFDENDPRLFDMEETTPENRKAYNEKAIELENREVVLKKFLDKKKLQALKHENDLTIEEYELLTDAFFVETKPAKENGKKK